MHGLNVYDFNARMQDPVIPRFTSMDPLGEKYPWMSGYAYCGNNPVNRIDPDGRDWYQDEDGNTFWQNSSAKTITSNNSTYTNIGVDFSHTIGNTTYDYEGNKMSRISVSVLGEDQFQTQFDSRFGGEDRQRVACKRACDVMESNAGITSAGRDDATQQVGKEIGTSENHSIVPTDNQANGDKTLVQDVELNGKPVIVGVDSNKHGRGYNDGTTDHWVVVAGFSYNLSNGKTSYTYFDPGNRSVAQGASSKNVFKKTSNGLWTHDRGRKIYTVTNIRPNRK